MALIIFGYAFIYVLLLPSLLWVVPLFIKHKNIRKIIFIIWFLVPTWDFFLTYPIYKFLC
jgi:hypothetical protein